MKQIQIQILISSFILVLCSCRGAKKNTDTISINLAEYFSTLSANQCQELSISFHQFIGCSESEMVRLISIHSLPEDSVLLNDYVFKQHSKNYKSSSIRTYESLKAFGERLNVLPRALCGGYGNLDTLMQVQIYHHGKIKSTQFYCKKSIPEQELIDILITAKN